MKKLLSVLAAFGMMATTGVATANVVSCGDVTDNSKETPTPPNIDHPDQKVMLSKVFGVFSIDVKDLIDDNAVTIMKAIQEQFKGMGIDWNQLTVENYFGQWRLQAKEDSKWYEGNLNIFIEIKKRNLSDVFKKTDIGNIEITPGEYEYKLDEAILEKVQMLNGDVKMDDVSFISTDDVFNGKTSTGNLKLLGDSKYYNDDTNGEGIEVSFTVSGLIDITQDLTNTDIQNDPITLSKDNKERENQVKDVLKAANPNLETKYLQVFSIDNYGNARIMRAYSFYYYDFGASSISISFKVTK